MPSKFTPVVATVLALLLACDDGAPPAEVRKDPLAKHWPSPTGITEADRGPSKTLNIPVEPTANAPLEESRQTDNAPRLSVTDRLLYRLGDARFEPPLPTFSQARCLSGLREVPASNPFSGEPESMNTHHRRIPLVAGPRLRDIRDALTVKAPIRIRWKAMAWPPSARLRFAYALGKCAGWRRADVTARVTLFERGKAVWSGQKDLQRTETPLRGRRHSPWTEVEFRLPAVGGENSELELSLETEGGSEPVVSLAEVHLVGRPERPANRRDKNVLLIIVDALRGDLVGPSRRLDLPRLAPNIDAFMARGTSFRRAYAVSNQTRHSTLALFTSQTPTMGRFFSRGWLTRGALAKNWYAQSPPLLPLQLAAEGWRTSTIGHNRFLFVHHPWGMDHGFDHIWNNGHRSDRDTPQLVDQAVAYLKKYRNERFFLYFNLVTPHLPYRPPKRYVKEVKSLVGRSAPWPGNLTAAYLGEIRYLDDQFGRFMRAFDQLGLAKDTLVIFTSDHGEVFHLAHGCRRKKGGLGCRMNHGLTLYDEEIHIPLALIGPGIEAGRVVAQRFSHLDLAPTILDLLGIEENPRHSGKSWAPQLRDTTRTIEEGPIYAESRRSVSFIDESLKLIIHSRGSHIFPKARLTGGTFRAPFRGGVNAATGGSKPQRPQVGPYEVYDLATDPFETQNLAPGGRATLVVDEMLSNLEDFRTKLHRRMSRSPLPPSLQPRQPAATDQGSRRDQTVAFNSLLLRGSGVREERLEGTIRMPEGSVIWCGHIRGKAACESADERTLRVSLAAGPEPAGLAFETRPWGAVPHFLWTLSGEPLKASDMRLGPFGLRMANGNAHDGDALVRDAQAKHPPKLARTGESGVYFWRNVQPPNPDRLGAQSPHKTSTLEVPSNDVPLGPEALEASGGERMDPSMLRALKELGYSR